MFKSEIYTNPYKCFLCDKPAYKNANGIARHILSKHSIDYSIETYFAKYLTKDIFLKISCAKVVNSHLPIEWRLTNICFECGSTKCSFQSFGKGFTIFCSEACAHKNSTQKQITGQLASSALKKKYGVTNASQLPGHKEKCIKTSRKKWGVDNPGQSNIIKEKIRQTNLKIYGKEFYAQTEECKKRIKATSIKKYGVEHFTKSNIVKEKTKKTNLKKYGVTCSLQNKNVRKKIEQTNIEKYNVKSLLCLPHIRNKGITILKKKYGGPPFSNKNFLKEIQSNENNKNFSERNILDTNFKVIDWLKAQSEPKPAYSTVKGYFPNAPIELKVIENYIKQYRENKTFIEQYCSKLFETVHFNKKPKEITNFYKPDFKLSPRIFLNADGLYWHSEQKKDKWYHFNLRKEFEEHNLRIFQFREDEIRDKPQIVKSIVNNSLGKTKNRIFARKCKIKSVKQPEALHFLNENHLMGSTNAKHLGLFFENKPVSLLSYKQRKNICKIERFCSVLNTNVIGGFTKLLSHLEQNCLKPEVTEIHNWVDLRYGSGKHLKTKGFDQNKETLGWKWTDNRKTYNRLRCRANMDDRKLTQQQHADELGWFKIYDSGQRLWKKSIIL